MWFTLVWRFTYSKYHIVNVNLTKCTNLIALLILRVETPVCCLEHRFSKCSVRSLRGPREKPRGSASYSFTHVFVFRTLLWGSVNYGQSLHGLHNTKSLRTPALEHVMHNHQDSSPDRNSGRSAILCAYTFHITPGLGVWLLSRKVGGCSRCEKVGEKWFVRVESFLACDFVSALIFMVSISACSVAWVVLLFSLEIFHYFQRACKYRTQVRFAPRHGRRCPRHIGVL